MLGDIQVIFTAGLPYLFPLYWRMEWQPTPVFLPGESHGQRSLAGYSQQGCKESDTIECLTLTSPIHLFTSALVRHYYTTEVCVCPILKPLCQHFVSFSTVAGPSCTKFPQQLWSQFWAQAERSSNNKCFVCSCSVFVITLLLLIVS